MPAFINPTAVALALAAWAPIVGTVLFLRGG